MRNDPPDTRRRADHRLQEAARRQRLEARLGAAERHIVRGRLRSALRQVRKLLREPPDDLASLNRLGDLLVRCRQIERGIRLYLRIAAAHAASGFSAKAVALYGKVLRLDPTVDEARQRRRALTRRHGLAPLDLDPDLASLGG